MELKCPRYDVQESASLYDVAIQVRRRLEYAGSTDEYPRDASGREEQSEQSNEQHRERTPIRVLQTEAIRKFDADRWMRLHLGWKGGDWEWVWSMET